MYKHKLYEIIIKSFQTRNESQIKQRTITIMHHHHHNSQASIKNNDKRVEE